MKRREFLGIVGGAAAWPVVVRAQPGRRLPTVGFLGSGTPTTAGPWVAAFTQRLRDLGWIEDRTIKIDLRWAEGRNDRSAEIAADFVRLSSTLSSPTRRSTPYCKASDRHDPNRSHVGRGTAQHWAGHQCGASGRQSHRYIAQHVDLAGKRFELLREAVPALRSLAILFNINNPNAALEIDIVRKASGPLGLEVLTSEIRPAEDIAAFFAAIKAAQVDALFVVGDPLTFVDRNRIQILAMTARLPTVHVIREFVEAGGLISMVRTIQICFIAPPILLRKFCGGRSQATCRSSNQPSTIWSSTSRLQRHSVSTSRRHSSPAPTR